MSIQLAPLLILTLASLILVLMIAFNAKLSHCHWLTGLSLVAVFILQTLAFTAPNNTIGLLDFSPMALLLSQLGVVITFIIYWPLQQ